MEPSIYIHDEVVHNSNAAREVLPVLFKVYKPQSIIDIGCGLANWIQVAKEFGVEKVLGVDGDYVDRTLLKIAPQEFVEKDLRKEFNLNQKFDLAICLEVAEHLPAEAAKNLVQSLVNHADVIMFSAAVPGQGGQNHINEQWPEYWQKIFLQYDFEMIDFFRAKIWNNTRIERWYRQNLFLVVKKGHFLDSGYNKDALAIIHPELFEAILFQNAQKITQLKETIKKMERRNVYKLVRKFFKNQSHY